MQSSGKSHGIGVLSVGIVGALRREGVRVACASVKYAKRGWDLGVGMLSRSNVDRFKAIKRSPSHAPKPLRLSALSTILSTARPRRSSRGACRARKALRLRLSTPHSIRVVHGKRIVSSYREVQSRLSDVREDRVVITRKHVCRPIQKTSESRIVNRHNKEYTHPGSRRAHRITYILIHFCRSAFSLTLARSFWTGRDVSSGFG